MEYWRTDLLKCLILFSVQCNYRHQHHSAYAVSDRELVGRVPSAKTSVLKNNHNMYANMTGHRVRYWNGAGHDKAGPSACESLQRL